MLSAVLTRTSCPFPSQPWGCPSPVSFPSSLQGRAALSGRVKCVKQWVLQIQTTGGGEEHTQEEQPRRMNIAKRDQERKEERGNSPPPHSAATFSLFPPSAWLGSAPALPGGAQHRNKTGTQDPTEQTGVWSGGPVLWELLLFPLLSRTSFTNG